MLLADVLGRTVTLSILGFEGQRVQLGDPDESFVVPMPSAELEPEAAVGDELDVFVHLDSEDQPMATLTRPYLERDEVCFLEVTDVNRVGAFVDMGLGKELLVPFAEQTRNLVVGDYLPIGLVVDRSDRLCGTMRIRELLLTGGNFELDEWVEGEAWRKEPGVGVFVILERRFVGLLPEREPHRLRQGEATRFRIVHVMADGKVELSLRGRVHEEIDEDARKVLARLSKPDAPRVSDRSEPNEIRALFGLSKKAFKRAVGRLLKEGVVELDGSGDVTLKQ